MRGGRKFAGILVEHRIEENSDDEQRKWEKETTTGIEIKRDGWKARHGGETRRVEERNEKRRVNRGRR